VVLPTPFSPMMATLSPASMLIENDLMIGTLGS
jgi:hypothetical protein